MPSPLATATRMVSRKGTTFTIQPAGASFLGVQSFPAGATRGETRTFLSTLRCAGASPVASGGIVLEPGSGHYYLVSAVTGMYLAGVAQLSELTLLKTNVVATVKRLVAGSWSTVASGVRCAIVTQPIGDPSDKSIVVQGYKGTNIVAWGHMQTSVGLAQGDQVSDGTRVYLVSHDLNLSLMAGITISRLDLRT